MVGSASQNNFRNHTNSTVRSMIRRLRNDMGTYCTSQGSGSTAISNNPQATGYISSRGYSHWGVFNSTIGNQNANAWALLKQELDQNRPVVSIISSEGSKKNLDHSVVAYSYEDLPGVSNDKSCFILGWGLHGDAYQTPFRCQSRAYHFGTTAVIPNFWSYFLPWWHY